MITGNLINYSIQVAAILVVGLAAPRLLRLRSPGVSLRYWQGLLAAVLLLPALQPWRIVDGGTVAVETMGVRVIETVTSAMPRTPLLSLAQWLLLAVSAVAAARLLWVAAGLIALGRIRREARPAGALPPQVEALRQRSGLGVEILISDLIPVPVTFGWRQPTVLIPPSFGELPESSQVGIVCHELIHVRRRDWLAVVMEQGLRALLWFHPAVHVLVGRIGLSREQLVDREVVRITGRRRPYLDALWQMARARQRPAPVPALFLLNRSDLFERVALLAEEAHMSDRKTIAIAAVIVAVVGLTAASAVALFPFVRPAVAWSAEAAATLDDTNQEEAGEEIRHPVRVEEDGEISAPKIVHKVNPTYPEEARKAKIQGEVVCETIIDAQGRVVDSKVLESPHEALGASAVEAIGQWIFEPAKNAAGEPVDVIYVLTVKYRLDAGKKPEQAAAEESAAKHE